MTDQQVLDALADLTRQRRSQLDPRPEFKAASVAGHWTSRYGIRVSATTVRTRLSRLAEHGFVESRYVGSSRGKPLYWRMPRGFDNYE